MHRIALCLCVASIVGCGPDAVDVDAAVLLDAALLDAPSIVDAGPGSDAGTAPARLALAVPCELAPEEIYAASPDLSGPALDARGDVLRCAYDRWIPPSELASRLAAVGITDVEPTTGAHLLRIAFQTTRSGDRAAVSSARVLVPETLRESPSPMLVAAHGTAGLADVCAPSRIETASDALTLPWAARGWPIIAPDYAGLGTEGTQGYGDNEDTARSQLDAARALRALLPEATLSDTIVMTGHSQGGGVVLSAQALERTYGAGGDLALVIPFAPGWPISRDVTGYRFPGVPTTFNGGAPAAIASLFLQAWHAGQLGEERRGEGFASPVRASMVEAIERECVFELAGSIPTIAPTFGDLVDETLRTGLISCAEGGACTGTASTLWAWMESNILHGDPAGAPVLVYAGTADTLATPADVSCIVDHLRGDGVVPSVCVDDSTHFDIVARGARHAIDSAEALLSSAPAPSCPTAATLPACR
ncbi:MAG: hypothetical protein M3Y87_37030 [Myxococcota bacterium]|nr:hypothetical protein [Myxococcota bacterium]